MLCGEQIIGADQVKSGLMIDGFQPGTPAFCREMERRFMAVEQGQFIENPHWDGTTFTADAYEADGTLRQ